MISAALVREMFDYKPLTGVLVRRTTGKEVTPNQLKERYPKVKVGSRMVAIHRVVWLWLTGQPPAEHIDHVNRNARDNRWFNLREATLTENNRNRLGKGYRLTKAGNWSARLAVDNKRIWLGTFGTEEEAAAAYLEAKRKHHGDYCPG